jgi:hypothetical protein
MLPSLVRTLVASFVLSVPAIVFGGVVPITECGQHVEGRGVLQSDLDCTGFLWGVEVDGRLDMNGHTITVSPERTAIHCTSKCKIFGPGTVTGTGGLGVIGRGAFLMRDVTITGMARAAKIVPILGKGHAIIQHCTVTNNDDGITLEVPANIKDTVITGNGRSGLIVSESIDRTGTAPCTASPKAHLLRTTVTGSGTHADCATINCPDVYACGRAPRLVKSTCETSCNGGTGFPCTTLGICTND